MNKLLVCVLLGLSFAAPSCGQPSKGMDNCKAYYISARKKLNIYYTKKDTTLLRASSSDLNHSLLCPETRIAAVELKLSLLSLLKDYSGGCEFIKSLDETDFNVAYKKEMDYALFKGLQYEGKQDTVNSKKYFYEGATAIRLYLNQSGLEVKNPKFEEAYYNLFLMEQHFEPIALIEKEIDSLMIKYPEQDKFWTLLRGNLGVHKQVENHE